MADEVKTVAASIVNFLKQQLDSGTTLSAESRESLEVAVQCVEAAFNLEQADAARGVDLLQLLRASAAPVSAAAAPLAADAALSAADRAEAERLKNEGNELMKAERYREALVLYTRAVEIDPRNSVYFCNRAASHFKLGEHDAAVADCVAALGLQPDYGKAHGRLGLALTALGRHREARSSFACAAQLEPDNESYKQNLRLADERLQSSGGERQAMDLGGLLQNPALLNMATEMLSDPNMQNLISGLMNTTTTGDAAPAPGGMNALLEAGQALAQHMQASNPDLVEHLRRQVRPPGPPGPNQPPQQ